MDTSRCYMGQSRFNHLMKMLPSDTNVIGIDEHTVLLVDPIEENCRVMGIGTVMLLREGKEDNSCGRANLCHYRVGPISQDRAAKRYPTGHMGAC